MTIINSNQGAVKLSEVASDEAFSQLSTNISEDALTLIKQIYNLAIESNGAFHLFSDGRMRWADQSLDFYSDNRANKLVVRLLKLSGSLRTIDLVINGNLTTNTSTTFHNITLNNGDLLYLEIHKSQLISGTITVENAVNGGSIISGKTLRKVNLTSSTGMPAISIDLNGDGEYLNIPIAFRYDWLSGAVQMRDLMWAGNGERWKEDTTVELGSSTAISSGGAILNFLETSLKAWDAEIDTGGWSLYNDSSQFPVDGIGGVVNPTLTFSITNLLNEKLSGDGSFVLNKASAVNLQGHGVSVDFKIPKGYRRKRLAARFLYEFASGFINDQIGVFIIADPGVSNTLISPFQNTLSTSAGEVIGTFDAYESIENYRLCVHIKGTNTAAFRLIFDDVKVNPQYFIQGDAVASPQMAGFITSWGGTTDIDGWMLCDGRSLLRGSYPELFASIGTAFGAADASHFNIPDYRGRFLRGVDGLAGNDPDSATRTAMNTGGNTGNNVGSVQLDELKGHSHAELYRVGLVQAGGSTAAHYMDAQSSTGVQTSVVGGSETRPKNAYTNFLIKLYNDRKNTVLSSSYVEYVSNTESTNNVSDLISFSSRLEGSRFPNIDNDLTPVNLTRRVNFSRPISISDKVYIQTDIGSGGVIWVDASQYFPYHADKNDDSDPAFKEYGLSMFPVPGQPAQLDIYFRQNGAQKNHTWQFYNSWRYRVVLTSNPLAVEMSNEDATGVIKMYGGDNAPSGWLVCNGEAISRTAFNKLFNVIGERFGSGDGSTTFNLPESRGLFPRGSLFPTISGGTLGGTITLVDTVNEILTIPNHGFNHTGIPVKFSGSLPTGISAGVVYYVIYLTQHTIAIAGTRAAALIDSRVNLSSATTGGICTQDLDPDYASREASSTGGSTGLGSFQDDAFRSHTHQFQEALNRTFGGGTNVSFGGGSTPLFTTLTTAASGGSETRPKNFMVNFIIKY